MNYLASLWSNEREDPYLILHSPKWHTYLILPHCLWNSCYMNSPYVYNKFDFLLLIWLTSLTQRTWAWANSGRRWRTGKPGVLESMGSKRVGLDLVTEQQSALCHVNCQSKEFRGYRGNTHFPTACVPSRIQFYWILFTSRLLPAKKSWENWQKPAEVEKS